MSEKYLYATRLSNDLLEEIEKVSSVRWAGGERPSEWVPSASKYSAYYGFITLAKISGSYCLVYGELDDERVLSRNTFIRKCAESMPK